MSEALNIHTRLSKLPHKVALPIRELVVAEHLSEDDAHLILDAGECAGEHHRLLGFAVGYFNLRRNGVPVHDVIRMAKSQSRRVNLSWSASRWKSEHDRLSRAETLATLARDNVQYDVGRFAQHLPAKFPGYLIRSSRRLGMEGLRQRHCVASYHDQLVAGSCAIAAVFIDGKRWTVQLAPSGDLLVPLRIAQIKTRFNQTPSKAVHERIHALLGVALPERPPISERAPREYAYMDNLRRILPLLRQHGVARARIWFDGSGDSGSLGDIHYDAPPGFDSRAIPCERIVVSSQFDDGRWVRTSALEQGSLDEAIEDLTNDYLEETDIDWYNEDGGFGELVIDVAEGTVFLEVNVRVVRSTTEFSVERDIVTGEEV